MVKISTQYDETTSGLQNIMDYDGFLYDNSCPKNKNNKKGQKEYHQGFFFKKKDLKTTYV